MRVHTSIAFCLAMLALAFAYPLWLSRTADLAPYVPEDEATVALKTIEAVRERNFSQAVELREPQYISPSQSEYEKMARQFPDATPSRRYVIFYHALSYWESVYKFPQQETPSLITIRYDYPNGEAQEFAFELVRGPNYLNVHDQLFTHFTPQQAHRYDIDAGIWLRDASRIVPLAVAVFVDLFAFITFCVCFAGPGPRWRWRWLWLLGILIGFARVNYDLSNARIFVLPILAMVPPAGLFRTSLTGPWAVWLSVPVGAASYWLMRGWLNGNVARGAIDITSGSWRSNAEIE